jgi:uncharacterized protein with HEPN domain
MPPRSWRVRIEDILEAMDNIDELVDMLLPVDECRIPYRRQR